MLVPIGGGDVVFEYLKARGVGVWIYGSISVDGYTSLLKIGG